RGVYESTQNCILSRMPVAVSPASPRTPFKHSAPETALSRAAITAWGLRLAGMVLLSSSRAAGPGESRESREGRHEAPALNRVTTTSPIGSGLVPVTPPMFSTGHSSCLPPPSVLIANGFG